MIVDDYLTQSGFITVDSVTDGPIKDVISGCKMGRYDRLDLYLQGGGALGLNQTNLRTLRKSWGPESDAWIGQEVELYLGVTQYQGASRDSVLIRCISPPTDWKPRPADQHVQQRSASQQAPRPSRKDEMSDEIPF